MLQPCELESRKPFMASRILQFVTSQDVFSKAPTRSETRDLRLHIVKGRNSYCEVRHSISLVFLIFKCHCITMSKLFPLFFFLWNFYPSFLLHLFWYLPTFHHFEPAFAECWRPNLHVQLIWGVYLNPEQLSILDSFKMVGYHFRYVLYPLWN